MMRKQEVSEERSDEGPRELSRIDEQTLTPSDSPIMRGFPRPIAFWPPEATTWYASGDRGGVWVPHPDQDTGGTVWLEMFVPDGRRRLQFYPVDHELTMEQTAAVLRKRRKTIYKAAPNLFSFRKIGGHNYFDTAQLYEVDLPQFEEARRRAEDRKRTREAARAGRHAPGCDRAHHGQCDRTIGRNTQRTDVVRQTLRSLGK